FVCRESVPNSRNSVPISAGFDFAPLVFPVFRLTYMYGMPVGDSKTGRSRVPRSSARRSRRSSPVISYAESSPPRMRIVISKFLTVMSRSNDSVSTTIFLASSASAFAPTSSSASSASTGVMSSDCSCQFLPVRVTGRSSSKPHACALYADHDSISAERTRAAMSRRSSPVQRSRANDSGAAQSAANKSIFRMRLTLLQTLSCCIYVGLKVSATAPEAIGHYRIVSLIGEGGMGEVYLADDSRLGRRVAIKMLSETVSRDPDAKRRMLREARAVAALDHPNVCTIHEVGEHEGRPFIVMQYIEGETLFERMQRTRLSLPESLEIALQVAAALDEAHSHGVVHRDIKTLNIMLTPRGQVKVLDFGLARLEAGSESSTDVLVTKPGTVTGTAPYMSPEQLRGVPIDGRSDIFSFGVVLYEMAMGKRPFDRENAISTITAILFEEPPPVDEDFALLAPILRRALAKEPSKRYATAALLLEDLKK